MTKELTTEDKVIKVLTETFELLPEPIKKDLNADSRTTYRELIIIASKYSNQENKRLIEINQKLTAEKKEYDDMLEALLLIPGASKSTDIIGYCKQWIKRNSNPVFHT